MENNELSLADAELNRNFVFNAIKSDFTERRNKLAPKAVWFVTRTGIVMIRADDFQIDRKRRILFVTYTVTPQYVFPFVGVPIVCVDDKDTYTVHATDIEMEVPGGVKVAYKIDIFAEEIPNERPRSDASQNSVG